MGKLREIQCREGAINIKVNSNLIEAEIEACLFLDMLDGGNHA